MSKMKIKDIAIEKNDRVDNPSNSPYSIFVGLEHYDAGEAIIRRHGSTEKLESTMKVFHAGDILIARRNVYLRRAAMVDFDGLTSGDSIVLHIENEAYRRIIPFVLNTDDFWSYANQHADGSMSKRLSPKLLMEYEFSLPDNGITQVANILWKMEQVKEAYREVIARTDDLVKSQFIERFGNLEKVPDGWERIDFGRACNLVNGKAFKPSDWADEGVPIVRIQNLNDPSAECNYFNGTIEDKYWIDTGDLLFAWSGTPGTSFGAFIWERGKAVLNQHIFRVEPNDMIDKWFLMACFEGKLDEIIEKAHGGVGLRHITKKELEQIEFLLPPKEVQLQFAGFCKQSDKSKFAAQQALKELSAAQKALMRKVFEQ